MRPIHVCIGCAAIYLPPETPASGTPVSPAHCGKPQCAAAVEQTVAMSGLSAGRLGELARRAGGLEGDVRRGRVNRRAAHGSRATATPGGGRGKLR